MDFFSNDNERKAFYDALAMVKREKTEVIKPKQVREIVPIEKWLEDEYFVGPDGQRLYDYWKDTLKELFRVDKNYNELILSGSIG